MSVRQAQLMLVGFALFSLLLVLLVILTGRLWRFPLDYELQEDIPIIQLLTPPLFGVLGSAASYVAAPGTVKIARDEQGLVKFMIVAPNLIFLLLFGVISCVFHIANQPGSQVSFTLESYRLWLTTALAFFTLSVPVITTRLFKKHDGQ